MPPLNPASKDGVLTELQQSTRLWRGSQLARVRTCSTGFERIDELLPGGGWPLGAVTEIIPARAGIGELSLILPALRPLCAARRAVIFVRPPYTPYAPALVRAGLPLTQLLWIETTNDAQACWAAEQLLREGKTAAVLIWSVRRDDRSVRRLQLAAGRGQCLAFVYRDLAARHQRSCAALRIALHPDEHGLAVDLVKVRGGRPSSVTVPLSWPWT